MLDAADAMIDAAVANGTAVIAQDQKLITESETEEQNGDYSAVTAVLKSQYDWNISDGYEEWAAKASALSFFL